MMGLERLQQEDRSMNLMQFRPPDGSGLFCDAAGSISDRRLDPLVGRPHQATAHSAESTSACSSTVCVAFSCLSGG